MVEFTGQYEFLSDFDGAAIEWRGQIWSTSDHLSQAAKRREAAGVSPMKTNLLRTSHSCCAGGHGRLRAELEY
jgi:hypothetical protein